MVKVTKNGKEFNLNITEELQKTLLENSPKSVQKAVISRKKDARNTFVDTQETDDEGNGKFVDAIVNTHQFVYFDAQGRFYLRAFPSIEIEFNGSKREVLATNPKIKIPADAKWYGKGIHSHVQPIPGSELWDDGRDDITPHGESVAKGDPSTLIVCKLTREEVLDVDVKPTGDDPFSSFLKLSPAAQVAFAEKIRSLTE